MLYNIILYILHDFKKQYCCNKWVVMSKNNLIFFIINKFECEPRQRLIIPLHFVLNKSQSQEFVHSTVVDLLDL